MESQICIHKSAWMTFCVDNPYWTDFAGGGAGRRFGLCKYKCGICACTRTFPAIVLFEFCQNFFRSRRLLMTESSLIKNLKWTIQSLHCYCGPQHKTIHCAMGLILSWTVTSLTAYFVRFAAVAVNVAVRWSLNFQTTS